MPKKLSDREMPGESTKSVAEGAQTQESQPPAAPPGDVTPEMIEAMTDDEFSTYLDSLSDAEADENAVPDRQEPENDEPEDDTPPPTNQEPYRSFGTQEEYEADRDRNIEEAYNSRYRDRDELLNRIEQSARSFYADSDDPIADMLADLDEQAAAQSGQSVEDYRAARSDAEELEQFRREKNDRENRQKEQENIISEWKRGEQDLKEIDPSFDLVTAMQNPTFAGVLTRGGSVAQAYLTAQRGGAAQESAQVPETAQAPRREISQNAQNPLKGTGKTQINPAALDTKDFMAYIERQRNL